MDVVVVLYTTPSGWALFGVFSSMERAMHHVSVAKKEQHFHARYIRAEIGQIYSEKIPPSETYD